MTALPRTTGEILSDAVAMFRAHFRAFYLLALPFCAVDLFLREGAAVFMARAGQVASAGSIDVALLVRVAEALVGWFALTGMALVVSLLMSIGITARAGTLSGLSLPANVRTARDALLRSGPLLLTGVLFLVAALAPVVPALVLGGLLVWLGSLPALVLGGAVLALLLLWAIIAITLRFSLATQVVVLEGSAGPAALARSAALSAARGLSAFETPRFRLSVLYFVSFALSAVLQGLFLVPRIVLGVVTGWHFADEGLPPLSAMPWAFVVPFGCIEILTNALVLPFGILLITLFYVDLRVRYEGAGLTQAAPSTAAAALGAA